jgi:TPR repeat protein
MNAILRMFAVLVSLVCFVDTSSAFAQSQEETQAFTITPELQLQMKIPEGQWSVSLKAPQFLVDEAIADVKKDLEEAGRSASDDEIAARVAKMLSSNELYVYKPDGKAALQIDFSALDDGENVPSKKTVKASANAAGESMASESDVSNSQYRVTETQIKGVDTAYRLDLDFKADGEPRKFIGLIGFTENNWVFFYYTDRLANAEDYGQMETILATLEVQSFTEQLSEGKKAFADKNYAKALEVFSPLADQEVAEALYYIGFMHMKGFGVPQDHKVAAEWYEKAAEKGSVPAMNNLGFVYAKGDHGMQQNYKQAAKWYRMAAENGDVAAQFNIGRMYLEGTGVDKDPIMAYVFSALALEGGDDNAKDNMQRAGQELSPEQLDQAKDQLKKLKSRRP